MSRLSFSTQSVSGLHVALPSVENKQWMLEQSVFAMRLLVSLCTIAFIALVYLSEVNQGAQLTNTINVLSDEQQRLLRVNGEMKAVIDRDSSLTRIQQEASTLGMVPVDPRSITYIDVRASSDTVARLVAR
ncbi:MAG: hypothetical protein M1296_01450 [Chloroflexi bacterium]|nr:hypothetical protein [Chloroflexota bacterium]